MNLAQRIRQLRSKEGITLTELSKRSGVGKATLSRLENGLTLGTTQVLVRIAKAFGMDIREFLVVVEVNEKPQDI